MLRLVDANANRAREALRVLEDYARFVLDDAGVTGAVKRVRHAMAEGLRGVLAEAVLFRDTPGDVGREISGQGEYRREELADVVTAAGKRLSEALRSLEEYLKVLDPAAARVVERCRYEGYEIERLVAVSLRRRNETLAAARLYVLITESACRAGWFETARLAVEGGADVLQLREKELEGAELLRRTRELKKLCADHGALLIVNDRADVAALGGADGVHVGQGDLPAAEARKIVGREAIVGVSTHELGQALRARAEGADYIGAGPTFRSGTKPREIEPGPGYLRELVGRGFDGGVWGRAEGNEGGKEGVKQGAKEGGVPVFAIAGITESRLPAVVEMGVVRIAVTAAVTGADDPREAARRLKAALTRAGMVATRAGPGGRGGGSGVGGVPGGVVGGTAGGAIAGDGAGGPWGGNGAGGWAGGDFTAGVTDGR